ncbi:ATP-binding protein [Pseudomonas chlororaphis]|uniref:AAA family ATPase n=1 Tax=Pseudomonas chlororaphis TaxID=587753 RepID=UPI00209AA8D1|nr:ATP-binding protein [Pseudomonas chlororaphis]MCO7573352.1 ATP-binding protein [Pseudomonas chlororaphis]MCO7591254.1 ATP-binding protein [Pseudomonas chlororaphis]
MTPSSPTTLHLLCGKIASGKSTLASHLAQAGGSVLISEDQWLAQLYPGQIHSLADYLQHAQRLKEVLEPLVIAMLRAGTCVVLDFPANTLAQRTWLRALADRACVDHRLHFLDVDEGTCRTRLRERNERGEHPFSTSEEQFALVCRYFVPPQADEGLHIVVHPAA